MANKKIEISIEFDTALLGHRSGIYALDFNPAKNILYSAGGEGWLTAWDMADKENGRLLAHGEYSLYSMKKIDDHRILFGDRVGNLYLVNLEDKNEVRKIQLHDQAIYSIVKSDDRIFVGAGDGRISVWHLPDFEMTDLIKISHYNIRSIAVDHFRERLLVGTSDSSIYILDLYELNMVEKLFSAHRPSVFCVRIDPRGEWLYSGGRDAQLKMWSMKSFKPELKKSLPAHWYTVNTIALNPENNLLATGSRDKTFKIWDRDSLELLKVVERPKYKGHINSINCLKWIDSETLATASDDQSIRLWKVLVG